MPEAATRSVSPPRTWRPMALWSAGVLLALGLAWFVAAMAVPCHQGREAAKTKDTERLGPPAEAARKLAIYLLVSRLRPRGDEEAIRREAALMLFSMAGDEAFPGLQSAVSDPDEHIRDLAVQSFGMKYPERASETVPLLIGALRDRDSQVRYHATMSLGFTGPPAAEAVPAILAAIRPSLKNQYDVWLYAVDSLPRIRRGVPEATEIFAEALGDPDPTIRQNACDAIARLGPAAKAAMPELEALLNDQDASMRRFAADMLGTIGDPAATDPLIAALDKETDSFARGTIIGALGDLGSPKTVEPLVRILESKGKDRLCAVWALGCIGPVAHEAIPALEAALADREESVRAAAATALGRIRGEAQTE